MSTQLTVTVKISTDSLSFEGLTPLGEAILTNHIRNATFNAMDELGVQGVVTVRGPEVLLQT
jgi:hypothetical protein